MISFEDELEELQLCRTGPGPEPPLTQLRGRAAGSCSNCDALGDQHFSREGGI
jgi:hypothetical protein